MRENRTYGSEGGAVGFNRLFLPLQGALLCVRPAFVICRFKQRKKSNPLRVMYMADHNTK